MEADFILQPYADESSVEQILADALSDSRYDRLDIASAWVRRSGLRLLAPGVELLKRRGGKARLITGVSLKGATEQGLRFALDLFDEAYIFDQAGRTFHPKVFLLQGPTAALCIVGSANCTVGGLVENWEVALALRANLHVPAERRRVAVLQKYFNRLRADKAACRPLSDNLIVELANNPRYRLGDEDAPVVSSSPGSSPLFPRTRERLRNAPRSKGNNAPAGSPAKQNTSGSNSPPRRSALPSVVLRWWKELPEADAQRLKGSSPTNTVTLVQGAARGRINQTTWFREELFKGATWHREKGYERATVPFDVKFHGTSLGVIPLQVRQTPRFVAGEGNRTASLHWDGALKKAIRKRNVTGDIVTIELLSNQTHRLTIGRARVGKVIL